jgi:hypothetical protein
MLKPTYTLAEITATTNPIQQGQALRDNYERLLHDSPALLVTLIPACLAHLAKIEPRLAIGLLQQVYRVDGGYSPLFLAHLRLVCFEAMLPTSETDPVLSQCALQLWSELKSLLDSEHSLHPMVARLSTCPKVLTSLPMLTLMADDLKEFAAQLPMEQATSEQQLPLSLVLSLLQQIRSHHSRTESFQKEIKIDSVYTTLLDIYNTARRTTGPRENEAAITASIDILQTVAHLAKYNIVPNSELMKRWLATVYQEIEAQKIVIETMMPVYEVFSFLLTSMSSSAESIEGDALLLPILDRLCQLQSQQEQDNKPQTALELLKKLAEKMPLHCLAFLLRIYSEKRISLLALLNVCSQLSDVTLSRHPQELCYCITQALLGSNIETQRAALRLLQTTPAFLIPVMNALDGKDHWYTGSLNALALTCGRGNVLFPFLDPAMVEMLQSALLKQLVTQPVVSGFKEFNSFFGSLVSALDSAQGASLVNLVLPYLQHADREVRLLALLRLGSLESVLIHNEMLLSAVYSAVLKQLYIADTQIIAAAITALKFIAPKLSAAQVVSVFPILFAQLKNADSAAYKAVVETLERLAPMFNAVQVENLLTVLLAQLHHQNVYIRDAAGQTLGRVAQTLLQNQLEGLLDALLKKLLDPNKEVSHAAAKVLRDIASTLSPLQAESVYFALIAHMKDTTNNDSREQSDLILVSILVKLVARLNKHIGSFQRLTRDKLNGFVESLHFHS